MRGRRLEKLLSLFAPILEKELDPRGVAKVSQAPRKRTVVSALRLHRADYMHDFSSSEVKLSAKPY
jgi:hypothetical protein